MHFEIVGQNLNNKNKNKSNSLEKESHTFGAKQGMDPGATAPQQQSLGHQSVRILS